MEEGAPKRRRRGGGREREGTVTAMSSNRHNDGRREGGRDRARAAEYGNGLI